MPPSGTKGELFDIDGDYYVVRFKKPMTDTEGGIWVKSNDDDYMVLKFLEDEIKTV